VKKSFLFKEIILPKIMSKVAISIRNTFFSISAGQIVALLLNIITFGIAARMLDVNDFGRFNYLLAIVGILAKLVDFGLNPIVFRETSHTKSYNQYIGTTLIFKVFMLLILLIFSNLSMWLINESGTGFILMNLMLLNVFFSNKFTNIRELSVIPFKVELRMALPMSLVILDNIIFLILVLFLNNFENKLVVFGIFYLISNIPGAILLLISLVKNFHFKPDFSYPKLKEIVIEALPLFGFIIFTYIFMQADIIILRFFRGDADVGIYSVAIRLSMPLIIIPTALTSSIFSILVRKIKEEIDYSIIVNTTLKLLAVFALSLFLIISFNSELIINIIFGSKFISSKIPLIILSFSLLFLFINFFILDLFTALNLQKINFKYSVLLNIIVLPLYLLLIPNYSFYGASAGKTLTFFLGSVYLSYFLSKKIHLKINAFKILYWFVFNLLTNYLLNLILHEYVLGIINFLVLASSVIVFRIFTKDELLKITEMFGLGDRISKIIK